MKQVKNIRVDGVQSTDKIITILMNTGETYKNGEPKQDKYKIWVKDQKGNLSLPYKQFQKIRPIAGDTFQVETYEQEKEFTNPEGKEIKYMDRAINKFMMVEDTPVSPQIDEPQIPIKNEPEVNLVEVLQKISTSLKEIRQDIKFLKDESIKKSCEEAGEPYIPTSPDVVSDDISMDDIPF